MTIDDTSEECEEHEITELVGPTVSRLKDFGTYQSTSELFQALADPNRLRILDALQDQEVCVSDLMEITGMSQSAVSHALKLLRLRRLVARRRDGRHIYYRLDDEHIQSLIRAGIEHVEEED